MNQHGRRGGDYSKGMRRKVGIALAEQARALLLDDPTSGLDPKSSHEFSELLKQLSAEASPFSWPPTICFAPNKRAIGRELCGKAYCAKS